ncbi:hypothetical protein BT69DRAFT_1288924 [Atractiella rhizophila]|nr:hypothetical protein BT69DRAFT_1288924 [Atractiella rhizophila]
MSRSSPEHLLHTLPSEEDPLLRRENVVLRERVDVLENKVVILNAEVVTLKKINSQLNAEVVTVKKINSQLNAEVVTLTGRMENMERQLQLVFQRTNADQAAGVKTLSRSGESERGLSSHHSHLGSHHGSHPSSLVPTEPVPESRDAPPGTSIEHIILSNAMSNLSFNRQDG